MKRVNIYIKEDEDKAIDHLSEILDSNRSEVIRLAVREFADKRQSQINDFLEGLDFEEPEVDEKKRITDSQIRFYKNCCDDPIFFAENAISYPTFNDAHENLELYDFQKDLLSELNHRKRTITNKSRQIGGTMIALVAITHYAVINSDKYIVLTGNKLTQAREMLRKIKDMLETLPEFMRPKLIEKNKNTLRLDNGCVIIASACTADSLRGRSIDYLFVDEAAFIRRDIFDEFISSAFPSLMAGTSTRIHIMSTPCGPNHFMKMFSDAICNYTNFYAMELPWDIGIPGRYEEWKERIIAQIGLVRFQQEFECKFIYRRGIENGI